MCNLATYEEVFDRGQDVSLQLSFLFYYFKCSIECMSDNIRVKGNCIFLKSIYDRLQQLYLYLRIINGQIIYCKSICVSSD